MPFSSPGQGRKNRFSRPPQRPSLSPHVPDTRLCLRRCVRGGGVRLPDEAASTPEAETHVRCRAGEGRDVGRCVSGEGQGQLRRRFLDTLLRREVATRRLAAVWRDRALEREEAKLRREW